MELRKILLAFTLLFAAVAANADTGSSFWPDGFTLSYGHGNPNDLHGGRGALQWDWNQVWFANAPLNLTGYWDASFAHWMTNGNSNGDHRNISIVAFAPVFRLQTRDAIASTTIIPYLEGSVGLSALSQSYLGERNLGAHGAFQDLIGAGITFGCRHQYDLSYHYLHYSNAGLALPNEGIDVKVLLTFGYRFG